METASDKDFKAKVLKRSEKIPVLADFWAKWCAPCLALAPVLEKLEKENGKKLVLVKVNVDDAPLTSREYGINSIPAIKLFKKGKVTGEFTGMMPEQEIKQWLDEKL